MTAREQIEKILCPHNGNFTNAFCGPCIHVAQDYSGCENPKIDQILALEELAVVGREAELPENPYPVYSPGLHEGYRQALEDITKEGWVKEIEK